MNTNKPQWIAALSYWLVLLIIINIYVIGYFYDIQLIMAVITIPIYLTYYLSFRNNTNPFISAHIRKSMRVALKYFIVTLLMILSLNAAFLLDINMGMSFFFGISGILLAFATYIVIAYVIAMSIVGSIRAFKGTTPNHISTQNDIKKTA